MYSVIVLAALAAGTEGADVGRNASPEDSRSPNPANQATIVVYLPPDAVLTIDGERTKSRSAVRVFRSPTLAVGKTYRYTLRAEVIRNGSILRAKQNIDVRAGHVTEVVPIFDYANRASDQLGEGGP